MNHDADPTQAMVVGGRRAWAFDLAAEIELRPIAYVVVRATESMHRLHVPAMAAHPAD